MFVKIFLFSFFLVQVSTNPLLQALMQTCPICQNGSKNPMMAALAPMLFPQPPQNQPYPQVNMGECSRCTRTTNPCNACQPCMPQANGYYPYQPPGNPTCPSNNPNADIFNKIFSNPALQTIFDPNTKFYNENGAEIPKHVPCNNGMPNVVYNYIIIPPEVLLEDVKCAPKEEKNPMEKEVDNRNRNGKRRKPKSDVIQREDQRNTAPPERVKDRKRERRPRERESNGRAPQRPSSPDQRRERKPRRRMKNKNCDEKCKTASENTTLINSEQIEVLQTTESENEEQSSNNMTTTTTTESTILELATLPQAIKTDDSNGEPVDINVDCIDTKQIVNESNESNKIEQLKDVDQGKDNNNFTEITTSKPTEGNLNKALEDNLSPTTENYKSNTQNTNAERAGRKTRQRNSNYVSKIQHEVNTREETIVHDLKGQYPSMPETLIKDLLKHVREKVESEDLEIPLIDDHSMPNNHNLTNNQKIIDEVTTENSRPSHNRQQKSNRRRNRQRKPSSNTEYSPTTTKSMPTTDVLTHPTTTSTTTEKLTTIKSTTTEKPTTIKSTTTVKPTTIKPTTKSTFSDEEIIEPNIITVTAKPTKKSFETTTNKIEDELHSVESEEEEFKNWNEDDYYIAHDDYYPIFTDRQYFSDEVFSYSGLSGNNHRQNRESRRYEDDTINKLTPNTPDRRHRHRHRHPTKYSLRNKFFRRRRPNLKNTENTITRPKVLESTTENPNTIVTFVPLDGNIETVTKVIEEITINHESLEQNTEKINRLQEIEEIQFQTPPLLDKIDFETRPINKNFYYNDDDYKISTYSDIKTPQYNINEKPKTANIKQKPVDKIETVYARSKVVKYGQPNSEEIHKRSKLDDVSNLFDKNDRTVILAKSIADDDYW